VGSRIAKTRRRKIAFMKSVKGPGDGIPPLFTVAHIFNALAQSALGLTEFNANGSCQK
jgi:hypothetical protein